MKVSISPELVDETEDDATECEPQREEPPRRSQRAVRRSEYYGYSGDTTTIELADTATLVEHCPYIVQEVPGTGTFDEVYTGPHEKESEYQSLIDHGTGSLEELPEKQTAVGSKDDHVSKTTKEQLHRHEIQLVTPGRSTLISGFVSYAKHWP